MPVNVTFIPGPQDLEQRVDDNGRVRDNYDPHFYAKQVPARSSPWDTSTEILRAAAVAKDRARNKLVSAIRLEAKRLEEEQRTNLLTALSTVDRSALLREAHANVTRSIDGIDGASLNNIRV